MKIYIDIIGIQVLGTAHKINQLHVNFRDTEPHKLLQTNF